MQLIDEPITLAERIVNAIIDDIYSRSGGDWFFDGLDNEVKIELTSTLIAKVQYQLGNEPASGQ